MADGGIPEMEVTHPPLHDQIITTDIRALGRMIVNTIRGRVEVIDAPGINTIAVTADNRPPTIAVLLYEPAGAGEACGVGLIHQLHPDGARSIAASLWKLADEIDGGKVSG